MIIGAQMRASGAFLGLDQRALAKLCGLSLLTVQRMEASDGVVRGSVDSLMKLVSALMAAGLKLIGENAPSHGLGRGVRLRDPRPAAVRRDGDPHGPPAVAAACGVDTRRPAARGEDGADHRLRRDVSGRRIWLIFVLVLAMFGARQKAG